MNLLKLDCPAEYELGMHLEQHYQYESPSFLFGTCNPLIIRKMRELNKSTDFIEKITTNLKTYYPKFKDFSPMADEYHAWGFGDLIQHHRVENGARNWSFWKLDLPKFSDVGGPKANTICNMISANLAALIYCTHTESVRTDKRSQLFKIVGLGLNEQSHHNSFGLTVEIAPVLANWLDQIHESDISVIKHTIFNAYKYIFGAINSRGIKESDFTVYSKDGKLNINVYEHGGIWLEGDRNDWELPGFIAGTHNCQSSQYQLLILVALATINDLARVQGL